MCTENACFPYTSVWRRNHLKSGGYSCTKTPVGLGDNVRSNPTWFSDTPQNPFTVRGVPLLRAEKTWREVADRGLEIVICIGHIVGVVMLVVDHLC